MLSVAWRDEFEVPPNRTIKHEHKAQRTNKKWGRAYVFSSLISRHRRTVKLTPLVTFLEEPGSGYAFASYDIKGGSSFSSEQFSLVISQQFAFPILSSIRLSFRQRDAADAVQQLYSLWVAVQQLYSRCRGLASKKHFCNYNNVFFLFFFLFSAKGWRPTKCFVVKLGV